MGCLVCVRRKKTAHEFRRAFTLIELLVVIAIIAILAAVLFPLMSTAKANAQSSKCQQHEKQFIEGIALYIQDYNGWLPHKGFLTWKQGQHVYKEYLKNDEMVMCVKGIQAYGSNEMLLSIPDQKLLYLNGYGGKMHVHYAIKVLGTGIGIGRPFSTIIYPSKTPEFLCAVSLSASPDGGRRGFGWGADDALNRLRQLNLHNGGTNYAFVDGHVKWYRPQNDVFLVPIDGMDYDGDGMLGTTTIMR